MSFSDRAKNSIILKGSILVSLKLDKYFIHVIYVFILLCVIIWVSLMTETTLSEVEKNKAVIKELKIENLQKTYEMVRTSSRNSIAGMLDRMGSDVRESEKPLTVIKK